VFVTTEPHHGRATNRPRKREKEKERECSGQLGGAEVQGIHHLAHLGVHASAQSARERAKEGQKAQTEGREGGGEEGRGGREGKGSVERRVGKRTNEEGGR
jgi:hypothetical protein